MTGFPLRNFDDRQTRMCVAWWKYCMVWSSTFRGGRKEVLRCDRLYDRYEAPGGGHYIGLAGICLE